MHKKYTGFYLGYVIQNNDPDRSGKVKVYLPSLMPVLAEESNLIDQEDADIKIDFKDFSTLPHTVVEKIKSVLPWARQLSPLIGAGAATTYNANTHSITTVDDPIYRANFSKRLKGGEIPQTEPRQSGQILQQNEFILSGGHVRFDISDSNSVPNTPSTDPDNNAVLPELYSNQAKGMFSIPSVGAMVWVFFENGEWELPVYFGYQYASTAWRDLYGADEEGFRGVDYPNAYENNKESKNHIVREKIIFNSRAGALSFTGTDYFPKINLSHRDGTFIQLDNEGYKRLIIGKSSDITQGDEFKTVRGDSNNRIYKNCNFICDESFSIRVGSRKYDVYEQAKQLIRERADVLAKFKTDRTDGIDLSMFVYGLHKSKNDNAFRKANPNIFASSGGRKSAPTTKSVRTLTPKEIKDRSNNTNRGLTIPPETATYENIKDLGIKEKAGLSTGEYRPPIERKPAWKSIESYRSSANKVGWDPRSQVDRSPSTSGGTFPREEGTSAEEIKEKLIDINKRLDDVVKLDSDGGDQYIEVTKDYFMRCGAVTNDFPAVRVDPIGGIVLAGVVQGDNGASSIYKQTNLVEYTGNDSNFPCGNYTISCGNKFSIDSGSGGIVLRTTGITEIAGVSTKVSGMHLLELTTGGNLSLQAGKSLTISADILSLRQSKNKQMVLGGSVGVENNITVGGSAFVNGELYLQHVTAPAEIQTTDQTHQLRGWSRRESSEFSEPVAAIPAGRIIVKLTKDLCYQICRWGGVRIKDSDNDDQFEVLLTEPTEDVQLPAWNDYGVDYGVPPEYEYDESLDEWVEKPGTGFSSDSRELPAESNDLGVGSGGANNDVPIIGTNRITSFEMEVHAHQFKNLPLSLRATPQDVIAEARDIESYPEVRGIAKGSRPAKILVKEYGESIKHKNLVRYSQGELQRIKNNNRSSPDITGQGTGNQDDVRTT